MANGILNVDGLNLYPQASGFNPDLRIVRPEFGGYGLLDDGESQDWQNFRDNFAGGILNGYQYDPFGGHTISPINPSGVYSGIEQEGGGGPGGSSGGGNGFFNMQDLMGFEASMRGANFGEQDRISAFSGFVDKGNGTFDVDPGSPLSSYLTGRDEYGNIVPLNQAVYQQGSKAGMPLERSLIIRRINAALAGIDESGGMDGSQGDAGEGNEGGGPGGNDGGGAGSGTGGGESGSGGGMGGGAGSF